MIGRTWPTRMGTLALIVAVAGWLAAIVGVVMVRYAMGGEKLAGFGLVPLGAGLAAASVALALIAIVWRFAAKKGRVARALVALIGSAVFLTWLAAEVLPARGAPMIHDVTTDPDDPPAFTAFAVDTPSARGLKGGAAEWRALHDEAYGDLAPLRVAAAPREVVAAAAELARERGWEIAALSPDRGRLEATATVSAYAFEDDVVLLARPAAGGGSEVSMRSVSRVGVGDLGYNAERVQAFLADLEAAL